MKRMRKATLLLALLLALVSVFTMVVPTFAANGNASANQSTQAPPDGLAVVAPVAARPDQPVTMTVFKRSDQTPVKGASVWALTRDQATQLQSDLSQLRSSGTRLNTATDWGSIVSPYGSLLGTTDARGKLTATFSDGGGYLLFAAESGYLPGRTNIRVVVPAKALTMQAPKQATANATFAVTVAESASGTPVQGASVWALTRDEAQALQNELTTMKSNGQTINATMDWSSLLSGKGTLLGTTDANGQLNTSLSQDGGYLLMAVATGYRPARARIVIGTPLQPLAVVVEGRAEINQNVNVYVLNPLTGAPVEGAGVWALSRNDAAALRKELTSLKSSGTNQTGSDLTAWLGAHGTSLGVTGANGNLAASFDQAGPEVLVAYEQGARPGIGTIQVVGPNSGNGQGSNQSSANGATGNGTTPAGGNANANTR